MGERDELQRRVDALAAKGRLEDAAALLATAGQHEGASKLYERACAFGSAAEQARLAGQLHDAMRQISVTGKGVLLYIRQEGRGIGLEKKLEAYKLQDEGFDTVEANEKLGYAADMREYGVGAQILHDLGVRHMRLLTNNPKKLAGLKGYGLEVTEQLPLSSEPHEHNRRYLETSRQGGHGRPHLRLQRCREVHEEAARLRRARRASLHL